MSTTDKSPDKRRGKPTRLREREADDIIFGLHAIAEALANPEALELFRDLPELRS